MASGLPASPEKKCFPVTSPNGHRSQSSASSTPNQHPYAIKTTSTALLTRSNSAKQAAPHQHVYVPNTPSPASRHRHSKSDLSRPSPRPLPIPPSLESPTKASKGHSYSSSDELGYTSVRARAETLPSASSVPLPSPVKVDELPANPRVWTTSQLASYLVTALRVRSGEALPLPLLVAKDIATFVKDARLNGRSFLRLNGQDLESMGINNLWREALLNASRNLRQNVLKGRIWGIEEDDIASEPSRVLPYRNFYNSSSSSIDETLDSQESTPQKSNDRKGRVRGLVASLERSSSSGSGFSNHGSSTSECDIIPVSWVDEEASFASGSEASEVEEEKQRAMAKKRVLPEPPAVSGLVLQKANVSSPVEEPTVEDLLSSGSMSGSWGAKAWEDMNTGETVKRIDIDHGDESASVCDDVFGKVDAASNSSIEKHNDSRKDDGRPLVKDIFVLPLPSRPLPSPPKSRAGSLMIPASPVRAIAKKDENIRVDTEASNTLKIRGGTECPVTAEADDSARVRETLALLEQYRQRIADLEEKISFLERTDAERSQVVRCSRGMETDVILPTRLLAGNGSAESRAFISDHVETGTDVTAVKKRIDVEPGCGVDSTRSSDHSSTSTEEPDASDSSRPNVGLKRQGFFDNHEPWDPLENGLSSYVLMVSFGVCAIVLSTVLKRLASKKS